MKYPDWFDGVVKQYKAGEITNNEIAEKYGLTVSTVSRWMGEVGAFICVVRCKKCGRPFERKRGHRSVYCSVKCGRKEWTPRNRPVKYVTKRTVKHDPERAAMMERLAARDAEYARLFPEQAKRSESKFVVSDHADAIARMVRRFQ